MSYGDSSVANERWRGPGLVTSMNMVLGVSTLKPDAGFQIRNIEAHRLVRDDLRYTRAIMEVLQSSMVYQNLSLRRKREMRKRVLDMELPR